MILLSLTCLQENGGLDYLVDVDINALVLVHLLAYLEGVRYPGLDSAIRPVSPPDEIGNLFVGEDNLVVWFDHYLVGEQMVAML